MNAPNLLSLSRIALALPTVWAITAGHGIVAFSFLIAALVTDFLDGMLARRSGRPTELGKILDPVADKVFVAMVLAALVLIRRVPFELAVVVVLRDLLLLALGWLRFRSGGEVPMAEPLGKVAFGTLGAYLAGEVVGIGWPPWAPVFVGAAYILGAAPYLRRIPSGVIGGVAKGER